MNAPPIKASYHLLLETWPDLTWAEYLDAGSHIVSTLEALGEYKISVIAFHELVFEHLKHERKWMY